MPSVQEAHLVAVHLLCETVDAALSRLVVQDGGGARVTAPLVIVGDGLFDDTARVRVELGDAVGSLLEAVAEDGHERPRSPRVWEQAARAAERLVHDPIRNPAPRFPGPLPAGYECPRDRPQVNGVAQHTGVSRWAGAGTTAIARGAAVRSTPRAGCCRVHLRSCGTSLQCRLTFVCDGAARIERGHR
jgi:hypothetical protein